MRVLVIGSGAREDAICKSLMKKTENDIFCAPGNVGMRLFNIKTINIAENDFAKLTDFVIEMGIDYTIVGPELPLNEGIVDYFEEKGLKIFGPNQKSAQIESSKLFSKNLMKAAHIPTALYKEFTDAKLANEELKKSKLPIVVKTDSLAGGKGVYIINDLVNGGRIIEELLIEHKYQTERIIIEEFLSGEEFSLMAFVQGDNLYPMPIAQDYKRKSDGDKGSNTGGMGAVCPVKNINQSIVSDAYENILKPFVKEMNRQGFDYTGVLYAGLILTDSGLKVIEFNVRFGDPETEVVIPRIKSNLSEVIFGLLNNEILDIEWKSKGTDLGVFVASQGYPEDPKVGNVIDSKKKFLNYSGEINFASIDEEDENLLTNGGRLFCIHAHADDLPEAQNNIYSFLDNIDTTNIFFRHDIGKNSISE
ncbi:phosphoribosylamine--glycine ligase [Companilactobacillus keshanensis]|uniref:Phosphoribosylamine--glycine ligase n=1 Tax=Companilactobacillus keshanensis TaxID=2486003 RepID=A0ABW4BPV3_9LACO|nr:phosphoribosylamine--glycine ligase [Companilactobacillus keshanensis]